MYIFLCDLSYFRTTCNPGHDSLKHRFFFSDCEDRRWKGLRLMLPGGPPETQDVSFLPYPPSLQLPITGSRLCLYEDGTELTGDYFSSVPDNSELVLLTSGQTWQGCKWWGRGRVAGKPARIWRC